MNGWIIQNRNYNKNIILFIFLKLLGKAPFYLFIFSCALKSSWPYHHFWWLQGIISAPQFPNNATIIVIVQRVFVIFTIEIGFETAVVEKKSFSVKLHEKKKQLVKSYFCLCVERFSKFRAFWLAVPQCQPIRSLIRTYETTNRLHMPEHRGNILGLCRWYCLLLKIQNHYVPKMNQ